MAIQDAQGPALLFHMGQGISNGPPAMTASLHRGKAGHESHDGPGNPTHASSNIARQDNRAGDRTPIDHRQPHALRPQRGIMLDQIVPESSLVVAMKGAFQDGPDVWIFVCRGATDDGSQ